MNRVDYFAVTLPNHGTRFIGECVGCGVPVIDGSLGSAFVCGKCQHERCGWCGYLTREHTGTFNLRRIVSGEYSGYNMPPGDCPDYNRAICLDCMRQFDNDQVLIMPQGIIHRADCCGDKTIDEIEAPYLRTDSSLWQRLLMLDNEHSTPDEVIAAIRALPKPWRADTTWRTP